MRGNIQSEEQVQNYQQFNADFGNVYNQLQSIKEDERCEEMAEMQMYGGGGGGGQ